tara:strand:+ start:2223 stop:3023 length:801 start_codon:yes stop_codon:yes gene_type:complete
MKVIALISIITLFILPVKSDNKKNQIDVIVEASRVASEIYNSKDEIYYLLKIPNLEIYKLKNDNGIKYLNSKKDFIVGSIKCDKSNKSNLNKKFTIIKKNLNIYKSSFLKLNNIKFIVLCENLFISEHNTGGIYDINKRTLILDTNFNFKHFERMIHHEIFHMIQDSHEEIFDEIKWKSFNKRKFNYTECSACSDLKNLNLYNKTDGFVTEYSKTVPSEDMAEIFSFMITERDKIENKIKNDEILNNKVNFIKYSLSLIDNTFSFQ